MFFTGFGGNEKDKANDEPFANLKICIPIKIIQADNANSNADFGVLCSLQFFSLHLTIEGEQKHAIFVPNFLT